MHILASDKSFTVPSPVISYFQKKSCSCFGPSLALMPFSREELPNAMGPRGNGGVKR